MHFSHLNMFSMRLQISFLFAWLSAFQLSAQPYLDLASVKFQASPDAGVFRRGHQLNWFTMGTAGVNIPLVFKDSSVLLFGPSAEQWRIWSTALPDFFILKGIALPITFVKPLNQIWTG